MQNCSAMAKMRLLRVTPLRIVLKRKLSGLKQFYMAVHPDLFGEHPVEKAVNETSLKSLNAFVDTLERKELVSSSLCLPFYVKRANETSRKYESSLKQIRVELTCRIGSRQQLSAMLLTALDSPHNSISKPVVAEVARTVRLRRYQVENGMGAESEEADTEGREEADRKLSFGEWLAENWQEAVECERAFESTGRRIESLRAELKERTGATDLVWLSNWEAEHFAVALGSLQRVLDGGSVAAQRRVAATLDGRVVEFTAQTGLTRCGRVALNPENVPEMWQAFLLNASGALQSFGRLPRLEQTLSVVLNGAQLVRSFDAQTLATAYESRLRAAIVEFAEYMKRGGQTGDVHLRGLHVSLGSCSESLQELPDGTCLVPCTHSPALVLSFLQQHYVHAARRAEQFAGDQQRLERAVRALRRTLALRAVRIDDDVAPHDAVQCLQRVMTLPAACAAFLRGRALRVCSAQSTLAIRKDGEIWLPSSL